MPDNLPKAVIILLWLLIGVIVIGFLLMHSSLVNTFLFAVIFYSPALVIYYLSTKANNKS